MQAVATAVRAALADGPLRMAELIKRIEAHGPAAPRRQPVGALGRHGPGAAVGHLGAAPRRPLRPRRPVAVAAARSPRTTGSSCSSAATSARSGRPRSRTSRRWMGFNVGQMKHVAERMELRTLRDGAGKPLRRPARRAAAGPRHPGAGALPRRVGRHAPRPRAPHRGPAGGVSGRGSSTPRRRTRSTPSSLDGQVAGTWRFADGEVQLTPFRTLTAAERRDARGRGAPAGAPSTPER